MAFVLRQPVRFPDVDRAGIVYFPRYMDFFHRTFEDFFPAEVGIPYHGLYDDPGVAFPLVRVESSFDAPLKHGEQVGIELTTVRVGEHSLTLRFRTLRPGRAEPVSTTVMTFACVDPRTWKAVGVPERIRKAFEKHLK